MSLPPFIGTAFVQDDAEAASKQWRQVADRLRPTAWRASECCMPISAPATLWKRTRRKTAGTQELEGAESMCSDRNGSDAVDSPCA